MASDKEPTVIKKYANRRLYHTGTSSYVTLEDLAHRLHALVDGLSVHVLAGHLTAGDLVAQLNAYLDELITQPGSAPRATDGATGDSTGVDKSLIPPA